MTKPKNQTNEEIDGIKKRGRKPKGGKIKTKEPEKQLEQKIMSNIILHLKCSMGDLNEFNSKISKLVTDPLEYKPEVPPVIMSSISRSEIGNTFYEGMTYNNDNLYPTFGGGATAGGMSLLNSFSSFTDEFSGKLKNEGNNENQHQHHQHISNETLCKNIAYPVDDITSLMYSNATQKSGSFSIGKPQNTSGGGDASAEDDPPNMNTNKTEETHEKEITNKDINVKLKKLKIQLYKNINQDKKSACFWCSYDFDNPPCYIPKNEQDQTVVGYGSFCRPECAVAFLMKENIDDTTKFERYHLINKIYGKIYNYSKNIKPAPNPFYTLDKYYGNMTIQEYRKLLKTEHTLLVLEKPLTRILPEIHEDNEELILNMSCSFKNSGGVGGTGTMVGGGGLTGMGGIDQVLKKHNTANGNYLSAKDNPIAASTTGYKVKKQSDTNTGPSKSSILKNNFGLS